MSAQSIQVQIDSLRQKVVVLRKEQHKHSEAAAKASQSAYRKMDQAAKSQSPSSMRSHLSQGEQEQKRALAAEKKANEAAGKVADIERQITAKQKSLDSALKQEATKTERDRASKQRILDRDIRKRRDDDIRHAKEIRRLSRTEVRHVLVPLPKPERLRILYLTANAEPNSPLRTEAEVGSVLRALRGARHRDLIDLQIRPAATPQDLLDGINDLRPHVVHFSGHGNDGLLAFDNASLDNPDSVTVQFDILAQLLDATDNPPTLLVMNACRTLHGSEILLEAVPLLIAMADSVGDAAAGVFATQFYSAIASGQSIGAAFAQAKVSLGLALFVDDAELPRLCARGDVDASMVSLVDENGPTDH